MGCCNLQLSFSAGRGKRGRCFVHTIVVNGFGRRELSMPKGRLVQGGPVAPLLKLMTMIANKCVAVIIG